MGKPYDARTAVHKAHGSGDEYSSAYRAGAQNYSMKKANERSPRVAERVRKGQPYGDAWVAETGDRDEAVHRTERAGHRNFEREKGEEIFLYDAQDQADALDEALDFGDSRKPHKSYKYLKAYK
jgi:hypothetical protein